MIIRLYQCMKQLVNKHSQTVPGVKFDLTQWPQRACYSDVALNYLKSTNGNSRAVKCIQVVKAYICAHNNLVHLIFSSRKFPRLLLIYLIYWYQKNQTSYIMLFRSGNHEAVLECRPFPQNSIFTKAIDTCLQNASVSRFLHRLPKSNYKIKPTRFLSRTSFKS